MRRRPTGDQGAYAILYGVLLLVIIGIAAIVVDLGQLRQSRRETRLAADSAAVAGAVNLDVFAGTANPFQACVDAWSYLGTNLSFTVPVSNGCSTFPTAAPDPCPSAPYNYTPVVVGDFTVTITWPVVDGDTLMTNPNVKPGNVTQVIDPKVDGTSACARLGVSVAQVNHPAFAGIFGTGNVSTGVSSVARAINRPGGNAQVAALNVLEPNDCDAVLTQGQGYIVVKWVLFTDPNTGVTSKQPGFIAVESAGHQQNNCPNNHPWVLDAAQNSSGAYVRADGAVDGDGLGVIEMWALQAGANPAQAYNPALVPPGNTLLRPQPTLMAGRFGDKPVRDLYDGTPSYISQLNSAFGGSGTPAPYANSPAPYNTQAFTTLPCAPSCAVPALNAFPSNCTIGTQALVLIPAHNYFVNCDTLSVKGTLVFAGGNVVTKGTVDATGCLAVNVPETLVATCPLLNLAKDDLATAPTAEAILYLRSGNLTKGSQGSMFLGRTFTYLAGNGSIGITGGGAGTLLWTNPKPDPSTCDDTCQNSRFGRVAFWTESTADQNLGGQSDMVLRGVLFMPKATFTYTGATSINQTAAQFWTNKIVVKGQSGLTMAPDPANSVPRPELATVLIR